jgi:hypothetical protein
VRNRSKRQRRTDGIARARELRRGTPDVCPSSNESINKPGESVMSEDGEIKKRKLTLNRETLTVLSANDLADVQGGHWVKEAFKWSLKSVRVVSEVFGISTAAKEGYDAIKSHGGGGGGQKGGGNDTHLKMPQSRYFKTPGGCAD